MDGQENNTEFSEQSAILKHLTSKWTPIVLMHLSTTPITFGRLRRKIPKISQRMLTQTLRTLERQTYYALRTSHLSTKCRICFNRYG
jgi:DNA-binding HxlR family transcriptional regulator